MARSGAPCAPAGTPREILGIAAAQLGVKLPDGDAGLDDAAGRPVRPSGMAGDHFQHDRPFLVDSGSSSSGFGMKATPLEEGLVRTGCSGVVHQRGLAHLATPNALIPLYKEDDLMKDCCSWGKRRIRRLPTTFVAP